MLPRMQQAIHARLQSLPGELLPVRLLAERLLDPAAQLDAASDTVLIGPRPKLGPEAYAVVLYAGISESTVLAYLKTRSTGLRGDLILPPAWLQVLHVLNGAELYQLHLYGLPPSLCAPTPLLNRSTRQPLDLGAANATWSRQYRPTPSQFHFGASPYSYEENLGYFLNPDGTVEARRVGGSLFADWPSIAPFLEAEITRVESLFPAHEARTEKLLQSIGLKQPSRGLL